MKSVSLAQGVGKWPGGDGEGDVGREGEGGRKWRGGGGCTRGDGRGGMTEGEEGGEGGR